MSGKIIRNGIDYTGSGSGIPAGGLPGQVLTKKSSADFQVQWQDIDISSSIRYRTIINVRQQRNNTYSFFGDSITAGKTYGFLWDFVNEVQLNTLGEFLTSENYCKCLCEKVFGTMSGNYGIPAQSIAQHSGRTQLIDSLTTNLASCSTDDIVFVACGINDFGDQCNLTTFRQAVVAAFDYIQTNKSAANDICILLPWNQNDYYTGTTYSIHEYRQIEFEEAVKRGFSVVDTSSYSPINGSTTKIGKRSSTFRVDGLHPSVGGYRVIAECLAKDVFGVEYYAGEWKTDGTASIGPKYVGTWGNDIVNVRPTFKCFGRAFVPTAAITTYSITDFDPYFAYLCGNQGGFAYKTVGAGARVRFGLPYNDSNGNYYRVEAASDGQTATYSVYASTDFVTNASDYVFCPELTYIIETKQQPGDLH